jgi:hypothetical protein
MARIIDAFTQFFDDNGDPLADGKLKFVESGTNNTDKDTFADINETIKNSNPVDLDGAGRCPNIFGTGTYNIISFTSAMVQIQQFDPVNTIGFPGAFSSWESSTIYDQNDIVTASDNKYYRSLISNNQNNEPSASPAQWEEVRFDIILDSISELRAASTVFAGNVFLNGYYGASDGGGGEFYWDSTSTETDNGGTIIKPTAVTTGRWKRPDSGAINIRWFGATGDGVTDDTTAIQAAIDHGVSVSKSLFVPSGDYLAESLVPKTGLTIKGEWSGIGTPGQSTNSRFVALGNGDYIFNQSSGAIFNFTIEGVTFEGAGLAIAGGAIHCLNSGRSYFNNLAFNDFADEAIKLDAGTASVFKNIFAQNCLLDITRAAKSGVIDVNANDCVFDTMEITASLGAISDANLYLCAFKIDGSNHFASELIGEISDIGFHLACDNSRFSICRADLNQGHGWELASATSNRFMGCSGTRNSQDTNNTYNQWEIDSSSGTNTFVGCNGDSLTADANKAQYGFNDAINSDTSKNIYEGCTAALNVTKQFNIVAGAGSAVSFPSGGPPKTFTAADATPSVEQYCFFKTGAADTYTDFDDGAPGQQIQILAVHAATLTNGVNIFTNTGANKVMVVNRIYTLRDTNGVWYEVE